MVALWFHLVIVSRRRERTSTVYTDFLHRTCVSIRLMMVHLIIANHLDSPQQLLAILCRKNINKAIPRDNSGLLAIDRHVAAID